MAEYTPIYLPGTAVTAKASATITGGQLVAVSGVGTVAPAGANAGNVVGVAASDALNTETVTYFTEGVHELTASGTVTAGDIVVAAASGQVSTLAAVTTPTPADVTNTRGIVGVALTTATNGNKVQIQVRL